MAWYAQEPAPVLAPERALTRRQIFVIVAGVVGLLSGALAFLIPDTSMRPLAVEIPPVPVVPPTTKEFAPVAAEVVPSAVETPRPTASRTPGKAIAKTGASGIARPRTGRHLTRVASRAR